MQVTRLRAAAGMAALAMLAAAPAPTIVANPGGGPALVVPADSPVKFVAFSKDGVAQFSGRFVLTGTFVYDCPADCEPPMTEDDVELHIIPDPDVAKRLPRWQNQGDTMVVDVSHYHRVRRSIAGEAALADLLAGKIPDVRGRMSIVVDGFAADFGCDYSPHYTARFVAFATPPKLARSDVGGTSGCI